MTATEKYVLRKEGFNDIFIRKWIYYDGTHIWEMLTSPIRGWNEERWSRLNYSEDDVQNQIKEYGELL